MMRDWQLVLWKLRTQPDKFWMVKRMRKTCFDFLRYREIRAQQAMPGNVVTMANGTQYTVAPRGNWVKTA